jgi:hypothetical protein
MCPNGVGPTKKKFSQTPAGDSKTATRSSTSNKILNISTDQIPQINSDL